MFPNYWPYVIIMALVTYLIRAVPLTVLKRDIENKYILSFLYYVPYACLAAMVFPSILYATSSMISAAVGLITALILAYREKSLITVSVLACLAVFICERLIALI